MYKYTSTESTNYMPFMANVYKTNESSQSYFINPYRKICQN